MKGKSFIIVTLIAVMVLSVGLSAQSGGILNFKGNYMQLTFYKEVVAINLNNYVMLMDDWFDMYMYCIVMLKRFVPEKVLAIC